MRHFCESHWASEEHGPERVKPDAGGRLLTFVPEGEACCIEGCTAPAMHTEGHVHVVEPPPRGHLPDNMRAWAPPPSVVVDEEPAPVRSPSKRPSARPPSDVPPPRKSIKP